MAQHDLEVFLHGVPVGTLRRTRNGARFSYNASFRADRIGSPELSVALPVQESEFNADQTANWFSGLLPEDARLEEVSRFYGLDQSSYLDVLEEIGWECAGAVAVMSEGHTPPSADAAATQPISEDDLVDRLLALPSHPYDTAQTLRISLGGYQEKLCVIARADMDNGHCSLSGTALSLEGAPTTHILKPQPSSFPGMIAAEAWGMTAAGCATPAASVGLLETSRADTPETLVVERFDRLIRDGVVERIHQEDCCQALGISQQRKYAAESAPTKSDPSFGRIARVLTAFSADPGQQLSRLMQQMIVNVALGNTDAHAKNYSLLHFGSSVELSPMYDVVPALEITPGTLVMGMRVAGRIRIDRVGRDELLAEAQSWGMSRAGAARMLDETLEALRAGIDVANTRYPQAGARHAAPALQRLEQLA